MWEHRLSERLIRVLETDAAKWRETHAIDARRIETAVDFFRIYADRTHHGKEEDILFRALATKNLTPGHQQVMDELVAEHVHARERVGALLRAKEEYAAGDASRLDDLLAIIQELVEFYPRHIAKEDKRFFYPCMDYFTTEERDAMLGQFWEFDRKMIHEKYTALGDELGC